MRVQLLARVGGALEEVARLGVRLLMQTAIEAEVTEFLGRERYSHGPPFD